MDKFCPACGSIDEQEFVQITPYEREFDVSIMHSTVDDKQRLHVHQKEPYGAVYMCRNCDSRFVHFYKDACPVEECYFNEVDLCRGGICKHLFKNEG